MEQNFNPVLFEERFCPVCRGSCLFRCDRTTGSQLCVLVWAEYDLLALAAHEAIYLQGLLTFVCLMTVDTPVSLCGGNQGALSPTNELNT